MLKRWIGRRLVRLGLRLSGFVPTQTVMFSNVEWTPEQMARWAVTAWKRGDFRPTSVFIPAELLDMYDQTVAGYDASIEAVPS